MNLFFPRASGWFQRLAETLSELVFGAQELLELFFALKTEDKQKQAPNHMNHPPPPTSLPRFKRNADAEFCRLRHSFSVAPGALTEGASQLFTKEGEAKKQTPPTTTDRALGQRIFA